MVEYIYFVKCSDCDAEPFSFFDDAKDYAIACLTRKPIITQTEICRNDFGECTDHCDLGTVWSWEDMMKETECGYTDAEPTKAIFTKDDLKLMADGQDPEFDELDNSLDCEVAEPEIPEVSAIDAIPDNFRKPIPDGMTIEQLVEEMEENEDMVECTWCEELFDKSMCRKEVDLGWLCSRCEAAIKSRGETLTFREGPMYEAFKRTRISNGFDYYRPIEFDYYLTADLSDETDDGRDAYYSDDFTYTVDAVDVAVELVEDFLTDEEVIAAGVEDGVEGLEFDETFEKFFAQHLDALVEKYYDKLLEYYKERAQEDFEESVSIGDYYDLQYGRWVDSQIDAYRDSRLDEATKSTSLDKLEEAADYRERLTPCPECGDKSYDCETGFCISCGFN